MSTTSATLLRDLEQEYSFQGGFELFKQFLARSSKCTELFPGRRSLPTIGILVAPWLHTPVPWFSITLGVLAQMNGYSSTYIWDDLPLPVQGQQAVGENNYIKEIFAALPKSNYIKLSDVTNCLLDDDDISQVKKLAYWNTIWHMRTSVPSRRFFELEQHHYQLFSENLSKIKGLFSSVPMKLAIIPGGIFSESGLYLWAGKKAQVRTATYDSGNGSLLTATDSVATKLYDVTSSYELLDRYLNHAERAEAIALAKVEFRKRQQGTDVHGAQVSLTAGTASPQAVDVLFPLNMEFDQSSLGQHQFFKSSSQWLQETIDFVLNKTEASVAVRFHPGERHYNQAYRNRPLENRLKLQFGNQPRFTSYSCIDEVNTYRLLETVKLVLPCASTVGLEAAALGKPVILESCCYYSTMPFVQKAHSKQDYFDRIVTSLNSCHNDNTKEEDAAWLLYFIRNAAHPFATRFTPQPPDFMHWVSKDLRQLNDDISVQNILKVLLQATPAALLQYKTLVQQNKHTDSPYNEERKRPASNHTEIRTVPPLSPPSKHLSVAQDRKHHDACAENLLLKAFPGVTFGNFVQILGLKNVRIGHGSCIGDDVWLNVCIRDDQAHLVIGEKILVGRRCMISTGGYLEIGDCCVFAPNVYVSDADHIFQNIAVPILEQGATINRSIIIEENCWLGINAVVMGNITVGRGSVVAANSVVISDVAPFTVVAGNPAKPIRMYNPHSSQWERVTTNDDIRIIEDVRKSIGIPSREELQEQLKRNSRTNAVDPVVAGRGVHL